jgi:hypothetical protein
MSERLPGIAFHIEIVNSEDLLAARIVNAGAA